MHKLTLLTFSLSFLLILPATAQLGRAWTDFKSYSVDLQNYLKNNLSTTLKPIEPQANTVIYDATGELNIPDPTAVEQRLNQQIPLTSISDNFENNSAVRSILVSNEINRLITRGAILGLLGTNGQIRLKTKLETTENILDNIAEIANDADKNNQQILDQIQSTVSKLSGVPGLASLLNASQSGIQLQAIKIQSEQSKILAENLSQTMQGNIFLQYSNLNLANISQQMEEVNRTRRVDTSAEAARLLRTTSQIDLFGRNKSN
jgi:gas vesicle protein